MHTNIIPDHNTRDQEQHPSQIAASGATLTVGDFHEWIYRSRRRAEEQWTRTLATNPPLFGCAEIGCDCGG